MDRDHLVKKCSSVFSLQQLKCCGVILGFIVYFISQCYAPTPQTTAARRSCWACPALLCVAVVWVGGWMGVQQLQTIVVCDVRAAASCQLHLVSFLSLVFVTIRWMYLTCSDMFGSFSCMLRHQLTSMYRP